MSDLDMLVDSKLLVDMIKPNSVPKATKPEGVYQRVLGCIGELCGFTRSFFCCCQPYRKVYKSQRIIITRFGRPYLTKGSGLHYIRPITDDYIVVDMRQQALPLIKENVLTFDNIAIDFHGTIYYSIIDAPLAVYSCKNIKKYIYQIVHHVLQKICKQHQLEDILLHKELLLINVSDETTIMLDGFGININKILITDITIPEEISQLLYTKATLQKTFEIDILTAHNNLAIAKIYDDDPHGKTALAIHMKHTPSK